MKAFAPFLKEKIYFIQSAEKKGRRNKANYLTKLEDFKIPAFQYVYWEINIGKKELIMIASPKIVITEGGNIIYE